MDSGLRFTAGIAEYTAAAGSPGELVEHAGAALYEQRRASRPGA
jgi:hypothetical protein